MDHKIEKETRHMSREQNIQILKLLHKHGVKIHESADGCRINMKLVPENVKKEILELGTQINNLPAVHKIV